MKHFFTILFGGLAAIGCGILIAYGGSVAWRVGKTALVKLPVTPEGKVAAVPKIAVVPQTKKNDATSISGFRRTIRYSADEEEDLINATALALPASADSHVIAKGYIVKNLVGGDITIAHNADKIFPIASITKLVTAIVARKLIDPDERITLTREIMAAYGNTAGFTPGEVIRAEDLLYPLLMVSSNDAAEAFAHDYGRAKFLGAMNDFTQSIGAYRTYFDDPSGLSDKNVSTANDLALILDWIRQNDPGILDITELKGKTVRSHTWINPTHFLNWSTYLGGKNGYTPTANRTGVGLFALGTNKNPYAVVILNSKDRDSDVATLIAKVK